MSGWRRFLPRVLGAVLGAAALLGFGALYARLGAT